MTVLRTVASLRGQIRHGGAAVADRSPTSTRLAQLAGAPAMWLVGIVALSALVRTWISLGATSPWVLPDELVYSDLSRSIAAGGRPAVRDVPVFGWGEVYPTVIAPVWALIGDRYAAYHAALVVNSFVMSLAAVPAYFFGRLFVSRRSSILVAGLAVLVPSLSYTGAVLTENACYPVFLVSLLAVGRAVRGPTIGAQALALVALGLLAFTRIQGVAMLAAYAGAAVVYSVTTRAPGRQAYLRRFAPTALVAVPVALGPMIVSVARGDGPFGWLGQRSGTFHAFHAEEVPKWFLFLAVGLVLYVAVLPAVATAIMCGRGLSCRRGRANPAVRRCDAPDDRSDAARRRGRERVVRRRPGRQPERALRLLRRAAGVRRDGTVDRERSAAATALVARRACRRLRRPRAPADPQARLQRWASGARARPLANARPLRRRDRRARGGDHTVLRARLDDLLRANDLATVDARRRVDGRAGALRGRVEPGSASRTAAAFDGRAATWVDDALPRGSDVAVLWDEKQARKDLPDSFYFWLMVTEFFNSSVGGVYRLGPATFYEDFLPTVPARLGRGQAVVGRDGRPVRVEYALVTCRTPIRGDVVARAPHDALLVVHVDGPLRLSGVAPCRRAQP